MSSVAIYREIDSETGFLYLPFAKRPVYGQAYFDKYVAYGKTTFGIALNSLRVGLVSKYLQPYESLLDVGCGDGAFMRARSSETHGYDINPVSIAELKRQGLWCDPYATENPIYSASFWDVLEHIETPYDIIHRVESYCFVSIPLFRANSPITDSKHYRPDEHCWYFTRDGLIKWFWNWGFSCVEMNDMETVLGREDIGTFVFRRR